VLEKSENHLVPSVDCLLDDRRERYEQTALAVLTTYVFETSHTRRKIAFIWDMTLYILVEVVEFPKEPVPQKRPYTYSR
jgi:hypothetical protein